MNERINRANTSHVMEEKNNENFFCVYSKRKRGQKRNGTFVSQKDKQRRKKCLVNLPRKGEEEAPCTPTFPIISQNRNDTRYRAAGGKSIDFELAVFTWRELKRKGPSLPKQGCEF